MRTQFGDGQGTSVGGILTNFAENIILLFVLAILIGAISKKESPNYLKA